MYKKSQGLSINVIIIVAIALIVLVVLIAIFTGRLGGFVSGIESAQTCESSCGIINMDGSAVGENTCSGRSSRVLPGSYKSVGVGQECCCTAKTTTRVLTARERAAAERTR